MRSAAQRLIRRSNFEAAFYDKQPEGNVEMVLMKKNGKGNL